MMSDRLVYRLEDAPAAAALVGGKALGLGRLLRAHATVPPGFVLTANAFHAFLQANGLQAQLAELAKAEQGAEEGALAALRSSRWPEDLRSDVSRSYRELLAGAGDVPVAVRSSATAEDSASASFAGQHATLLNVEGEDAVFEAILACWASLYGATALYYRRTKAIEDDTPAMGVVVQALVQSEASGVAFTLDPVSGDRDLAVIEAAWGLGEGVVSGIVTPDHYAVRKSDGAVVRREITTQKLRVVSDAAGGTRNEAVPAELASRAVLTDEQAVELARTAARIEADAGAPQDIEWALAAGTFYILQARPITAVAGGATDAPAVPASSSSPEEHAPAVPASSLQPPASSPDEWVSEFDTPTAADTIWTSANVQEVLPDQISPYNMSINARILEEYGDAPIRRMGVRRKNQDPFNAYFYGRPFLNVTMSLEVLDQTPFAATEGMM
jgi:phosphoenolpyruvate synthase/pyruvate phosphate dikinase